MIKITNIRNVNACFSKNWAIVRSLKTKPAFVKQVVELSPSTDLFQKYRELVNCGNWNKTTFNEIYVPQFIAELKANAAAREALEYLKAQDKLGKRICLACFCQDETLCHRSIIAGILRGMGCSVVTDTGQSYLNYYYLYK